MATLDLNTASVTDLNIQPLASPNAQALEYSEGDEVFIDYPKAAQYIGYYKQYGQLKKAIDTLSLYVCGKGFTTDDATMIRLSHMKGMGEDSVHSIFWNMQVMSMIVGDSFSEIVRNEKGTLINLKPISPERMRTVVGSNGMIKRYEQMKNGKAAHKFKTNEILHIMNDRVGDEQRGTSVIECCAWVIDAINEARADYRVVLHRNRVPVRIIEIDSDDTVKRNLLMAEYKEAITKGEVLIVPMSTVKITQDQITIQDPIAWIQSLENYFYLAVGIPRVIASPDNLSEGSSKVSYLIFEPIYTFRQILLESDLLSQVGIEVKFNRPPSLMDNMQSNEAKNTSQTGFQPKDMAVGMGAE
jgi:hypothetical protein